MVFYRKYRPQKISDLDSTAVRETLQAVLSKEIPHAFLFTGPKGLGKTSTARIVAKAVNCERKNQEAGIKNHGDKTIKADKKNPDSSFIIHDSNGVEPDNTCDQCVSITNGTNMDVLEIDAASNRGIDEIRDLKEKIRLSPVSSKMKVYIIDEVHMLTTEAFNALLKTLEEPPAHAMFILATTEPHKVPATILSRCFHINFNLATDEEIVRSLKRVIAGEKLQIDDDVLLQIAHMADGGFRDAVKLLEELVLLAGDKKITKELFEASYKSANVFGHVSDLLEALKNADTKKGLEVIATVVNQGMDVRYFIQQVIEELHQVLLSQVGLSTKVKVLSAKFTNEEIAVMVEMLSKAYQETKFAVVASLPLELVIIEWCSHVIPSGGMYRTVRPEVEESHTSDSKKTSVVGDPSTSLRMTTKESVTVSSLRNKVGTMKKVQALYGSAKQNPKKEKVEVETTTVELEHTNGDGTTTKEWMDHFWNSLINEMKKYNHTAAGVLRSCAIKSYDNKVLIISTAYSFHKERLEQMKTKDALVASVKLLTGKTVEVAIELKK